MLSRGRVAEGMGLGANVLRRLNHCFVIFPDSSNGLSGHKLAATECVSDDVFVPGASHAGWTAMESVTHATSDMVPPELTA